MDRADQHGTARVRLELAAQPRDVDVHVTTSSAPSFRPRTRNGSAGVGFDVWYDLPNQGKEALITVGFTFEHESDGNTYTYSDTAKVKVAP